MNKMISSIYLLIIAVFLSHDILYAQQLTTVTLIPMWSPQTQFAGFYVAQEKRIFEKYGIHAVILRGGPEQIPIEYLKEKKADIGIMWLSAGIKYRSEGLKIINIGQFFQHSGLLFIAMKKSGISSPKDMQGKKLSIWPGDLSIEPDLFLKQYKISPFIIDQGYSVNLFLKEGVDVICAMSYNEYQMLHNFGFDEQDLTIFPFRDHGLDFPEDGLYVMEETLTEKSDILKRFVQASQEGWIYTFDHPEEAMNIVLARMREIKIPANSVHQKRMLETIKQIIMPSDASKIGTLLPDIYEITGRTLLENGIISSIPEFTEFYYKMDQ
jgi:NitT/TauT family transport system substrate-binding protein